MSGEIENDPDCYREKSKSKSKSKTIPITIGRNRNPNRLLSGGNEI